MGTIILVPAYGRDYKSAKAVKADFDADKDFTIQDVSCKWNGKCVNKPQLIEAGYESCKIRFDQLQQVTIIKL